MKKSTLAPTFLVTVSLAFGLAVAHAENTDGKVTYSVKTLNYTASYSPYNICAVWVVDGSGKFVKTLCRHGVSRVAYLYKWAADRGTYTTVDGVTGATLTAQPQTHTVIWNCRGTNGQVVVDGTYNFRAEYTSNNAQGPYMASNCQFTKGNTAFTTNFVTFANASGVFTNMTLTYTPYNEVAVSGLSSNSGLINASLPIVVTLTNQTLNTLPFSVAVSNLTSGTLIGTQSSAAFAPQSVTNLTFSWNTTGLSASTYQIQAVVAKLATETNTANNVLTAGVALSAPEAGDISVLWLKPTSGLIDASQALQVRVTNAMSAVAGPFTVALSNVTAAASLIASQQITALAGRAATNVSLTWNTAGLAAGTYQVKACATPLTNETNKADNELTAGVALRAAIHDLAIHAVRISSMVPPNVTSNVVVVVTNRGDLAESCTAALRDVTAAPSVIGSKATNVASLASVSVSIPWNTAGAALGFHTLEGSVTVVAGDASPLDNTNSLSVIVASGLTTNVLVNKSAVWKYHDKGLDITGAPWKTDDYYDGFWASGPAPLGYALTNIATVLSYGGVTSNRYTTAYFRREFTMDFAPMALTARVMRVDGVVLYLNDAEVARHNMPDGDVGYTTLALGAVTGTNAYRYYEFPIAASNLVVGRNRLAAEIHLSSPSREAEGFSLELLSVNPTVSNAPAFTPSALTPDGSAQSGDAAGVSVTLANTGNITASGWVLIRDAATGQVLGSQLVGPLAPGETATVRLALSTFGAATGSRTLQALTVVNGVTNLSAVATAPFTLAAASFAPRAVDAAGSIGGRCNAVAAAGSTVYLGCGSTLEAWSVQDPASPVRTALVRLPGSIEDLAATNGWVYAATGAAGVQIVQAASSTQLVHRATYDTTGYARRLSLAGTQLFIADVLGGLRVLDVTAPASPSLAGAYATIGPAQALAAASPRLLVVDGQRGLLNLHASNPAALAQTGVYSRVTAGLAVAPVSGAALVADASANLVRISTATPSNLTAVTNALLPAAAQSLAASGSALYAAAGAQGLLTLNAATLALQSAQPVGGDAADVAVAGSMLYVAAGFGGALAFDITSPLAPQPLALFPTGARPVDAAAYGSTLYVAADEGGLQLHRLEQLGMPTRLGVLPGIANSRCVAVAYPNLFVAEGLSGLKIFDITSPGSPALRGSYAAAELSHIRRLAVAGDRVALTDGSKILLLSVANPGAPALLASQAPGGFVFDLAAAPGELYAACGGAGVKALRMDSLGVDSTVLTPGSATAVTLSSNLLTVACGPAGWLTLNIDNAASPVQVNATPGLFAFDAAASGRLLSLTDGGYVADVINLSAPLSPVLSNSFANLTAAMRVKAVSGLVLTAEDEAGLAILNASPGDINMNGVPDEWEQQIVSASVLTNGPVRSVLDIDLQTVGPNGFTYYQSYLAGLTPTDPKSVLAISAAQPLAGSGNQFTVSWQSVAGKRYTLYKCTDLAAGFAPVPAATGITASGALTSFTDTVGSARAFYMVVLAP